MSIHKVKIDLNGKEYSLETGKLAKYASGSVLVSHGDTMVLVTVVAAKTEKPDLDFLPLQVEYRVKTASVGKIPGGFLKREGRPSDYEILSSRLIDRPIRPMIPKTWRFETQIVANVFSCDPNFDPDTLGMVGASAALMISDIPFHGPVSEVRVGKVDGEFIINPSSAQLKLSSIDLNVAGTDSSIAMVEGEANEISEVEFLEALEFAHENIKKLNAMQRELADLVAPVKREFSLNEPDAELVSLIKNEIENDLNDYVHKVTNKTERHEKRTKMLEMAVEKVKSVYSEKEDYVEAKMAKTTSEILSKLEKKAMRKMILEDSKRLDGRGLTDIRPIACEIGLLPRAHGSALFTRGETQSLTTSTLGTSRDEQMIDGILPTYTNNFYLHYNFPPYSTGEVGRMTGVGRTMVPYGNTNPELVSVASPV